MLSWLRSKLIREVPVLPSIEPGKIKVIFGDDAVVQIWEHGHKRTTSQWVQSGDFVTLDINDHLHLQSWPLYHLGHGDVVEFPDEAEQEG